MVPISTLHHHRKFSHRGQLRRTTKMRRSAILFVALLISMMNAFYGNAFSPTTTRRNRFHPLVAGRSSSSSFSSITTTASTTTTTKRQMVYDVRDADFGEMIAGGQRYEMIPLPDSMVPTTIFVGNLCEFCNDDDLCQIFQTVSSLQSVPAIVARKPNMNSLQYGFVSFPTVEEKEKAILRFHGVEFMGRKLKVEEIRDDGRMGRVRVPEKIVTYVVGEAKRFSGGKNRRATNTLRRIERLEKSINTKSTSPRSRSKSSSSSSSSKKIGNSISGNGKTTKKEAAKRPQFVLTSPEQEEMDRAVRRGFISLEGSSTKGYTRRRCTQSRLAAAHRQWCDTHRLPHIVHCKANSNSRDKFWGNGELLDWIIVDLSPLRIHTGGGSSISDTGTGITTTTSQNNNNNNSFDVNDFLVRWKAEIATAAAMSGMELRRQTFKQDNYEMLSALDDDDDEDEEDFRLMNDNQDNYDDDDEECMLLSTGSCSEDDYDDDEESTISLNTEDAADYAVESVLELSDDDSWSTDPISSLPFLTMGIFEGNRGQAKAMAKELAQLWGTTESSLMDDDEEDDDNGDDNNNAMDDLLDARFPHEQYTPALSHRSTDATDRRKHNGRNSSNGPSKKRRRSENRRRRRNFNSRDIDLHMF
mmetsp:Transcript_20763/g.49309  ORF Transcript_20763/g.49309 Transcript_20763/m.49309 type:complete len:642 (-) Transcript_20763:833-2758(-)